MERMFLLLSGISGFLAVALGAFGAHGLKSKLAGLPEAVQRLGWWETAAHYHLVHALSLGLVGALATRLSPAAPTLVSVAGYGFLAGTLLFSGSLYVMTLTNLRALGAVTPLGGLCLLAGWGALALAAWKL
ncbi:MAG: DUF423 domain-containing protein [Myxococcales bacterium]|nr:DUF423 domain-containing protein [Myxococcales bacterium]